MGDNTNVSKKEYLRALSSGASLLGDLSGVSTRKRPKIESFKPVDTVDLAWKNVGNSLKFAINRFEKKLGSEQAEKATSK